MVLCRLSMMLLFSGALLFGGDARVESNVVFGMYSGLALLMDVFHPERPNGLGIVYISGSGWHAPLDYAAQALKQSDGVETYAGALAKAGYVVFSVNHRSAPRFRYPAAVEDVQRAVRFVRHNAKQYGIDPGRIGAAGGSSGGHLVAMLGVLDGKGIADDTDPINRLSAKVQCVVARAAPCDLVRMESGATASTVASFMGFRLGGERGVGRSPVEHKAYLEASPIHHVSADDPPMLLIHGDKDPTVPFEQSERMEKALKGAGVEARLFRIPGGAHGGTFGKLKDPPDYLGEMVRWFDGHLKPSGQSAGR